MIGYCVKCRSKEEMKDPQSYIMSNKKPATLSICTRCGTKIFRIGKVD